MNRKIIEKLIESLGHDIENDNDAAEVVDQLIQLCKPTEWISVKDKLPPEGIKVFVRNKFNTVGVSFYAEWTNPRTDEKRMGWQSHDNPTHWLPIPETKDKEQNDE